MLSLKQTDYSIYLVTDETQSIDALCTIVEQAVKGGVSIVQLREKTSGGKVFLEKAKSLKAILEPYGVPLVINDRVDVALAAGAEGVHVGQSDLPLADVRKIVPSSMIVGVSVSNVEEALAAEKAGADYVGVGAVFPTDSKKDAELLMEGMLEQVTSAISIPVVAIGGIKLDNIEQLAGKNLAGAAIVSAIMHAESPYEAARSFRDKWK